MEGERPEILTIGHSTHDAERFVRLLRAHRIEAVADVRRHPGSRRLPHFNAGALRDALAGAGIAYEPLGDTLGGRRKPRPDSPNAGWRSPQFRGYADHMGSDEFAAALDDLDALAREQRTALMCAEGDWRRCHRQLIADALLIREWQVLHVLRDGRVEQHVLTPFAATGDEEVVYPPTQGTLDDSDRG